MHLGQGMILSHVLQVHYISIHQINTLTISVPKKTVQKPYRKDPA